MKNPPSVPGNIPLIGSSVVVVCPQGHIDRLPAPGFGIIMEGPQGQRHTLLCRACYLDFFAHSFPARALPGSSSAEDAGAEILAWRTEIERQQEEFMKQAEAEAWRKGVEAGSNGAG